VPSDRVEVWLVRLLALIAEVLIGGRMGGMSDIRRNALVRSLAELDQLLAELEDIAENPEDNDRDRAIELLIEFEGWRVGAERKLRDE
jgi:hypothetical protein